MRARTPAKRFATLLLAWLVLVPVAVLGPSGSADAVEPARIESSPQHHDLTGGLGANEPTAELQFGRRLSSGTTTMAARGAAAALPLPTQPELDRPEFRIWPHEDLNQLVNLDSFLMITDGFEVQQWCYCFWFFNAYFRATPFGSTFEFRETDTGRREEVDCWGPGAPWFPGMEDASSFPFCGKEWEHSSSVTGEVEAEARVNFIIVVTGSINLVYPAQSRASDTKILDVGEVQSIGQTIALPVVDPPGGSDSGGFCSHWGISVVCWVGEQAADLALDAILAAAPFLREVKSFFDGCAGAALDAVGGVVDILRELKDAITDPVAFVNEKLQEFRDLIEAVREDPVAFAEEVLGDLARLDVLENEGLSVWLGEIICMLAIEYFTGKAATTIVAGARRWLRDRRDNPDGPDVPDPNCILSSFPGATRVLMADGTHERIDDIRPGDRVMSFDVDTSVWEPKQVLDQWSHVDRGPPAWATLSNDATITATDDHPFFVPATGSVGSWVELRDLESGDLLLTPNGPAAVDSVLVGSDRDWVVWELTVEDNHNFAVQAGDADLLVHNGRRCPGDPDDINHTNHPDGPATAAEQAAWERYLERMDAEGTVPLTADEWLARKRDLDAARLRGSAFENDALTELGLDKNTLQIGDDPGFIPDGIRDPDFRPGDPADFVEMKNVEYLSDTGNVSAMLDYIQENGGDMELVIGPQTRISEPLRRRLEEAGATVSIFENGTVRNVPLSSIPSGPP